MSFVVRKRGPLQLTSTQKNIGRFVAGFGIVITTSDCLLNSVFLSWLRKAHSLKSDDKIVRLSTKMELLADQVLKEIRIKSNKKLLTKFFCAKGLDIVGLGNSYLKFGMSVGIPHTFSYEAQDEIDPNLIATLFPGPMNQDDWYKTDQGKKLLESIKLSEAAKKFAIACELHYLDSPEPFLRSLLIILCYGATILGFDNLRATVKFYSGLIGQIILFWILGFASVALYCIFNEIMCDLIRNHADRKTIRLLKEEYRRGAVEYYEKLIQRNKQLRRLLKDGTSLYDKDGDKMSWYGLSYSSLEFRLSSVKQQVAELDSPREPGI